VIELRFHRDIYDGASLDSAMQLFLPHGRMERSETPSHFIVALTANDPSKERRIAGELANYALGLTVRSMPADAADASNAQGAT